MTKNDLHSLIQLYYTIHSFYPKSAYLSVNNWEILKQSLTHYQNTISKKGSQHIVYRGSFLGTDIFTSSLYMDDTFNFCSENVEFHGNLKENFFHHGSHQKCVICSVMYS